jgi:Na+/phosphate symporter
LSVLSGLATTKISSLISASSEKRKIKREKLETLFNDVMQLKEWMIQEQQKIVLRENVENKIENPIKQMNMIVSLYFGELKSTMNIYTQSIDEYSKKLQNFFININSKEFNKKDEEEFKNIGDVGSKIETVSDRLLYKIEQLFDRYM